MLPDQRKETTRQTSWILNWGKSSPANRGIVEYISIQLPQPADLVLYLGNPRMMQGYVSINPWLITVGNGGTSFDFNLGNEFSADASVRGNVLHFVADQLVVRGQTNMPSVPADAAASIRFSAQCGVGRPSTSQRMQWQIRQANGDSEIDITLSPWSTHAQLHVSGAANVVSAFLVRQVNVSPTGSSDVMPDAPIGPYLEPGGMPLHPWCNQLIVTTTGGGGDVYQVATSETFTM